MDKIDRMLASFENALKSISKDKLDRIINRIDALYSSEQQSVIEYFNSFEEHYEDLYQLSSNVEYSADEFVSSSKSLNIQDNKYSNPKYVTTNCKTDGINDYDYSPSSNIRQAA